ncbi:adenosylcobinamide-GDP ribazoletransferase [Methylobrevis albus]|uniref:adenosylcobinamide-GDP ribazoletransferase n=1 Tax=Methylobrevis albus TaxID=2793297 RepID=UPI001F1945A5|nr:adenosylcobinamide-GDP ribazoletransferase [Methylobrevis albus]
MLRTIADLAAVLRFFSRLPVPRLGRCDDPAALPDFSRAAPVVPLAGVVIVAPAALLVVILGSTDLPTLAVAVHALALTALLTGAFHEDGLADIADGFGGGSTPARRLEIMKDSRVGAFGALALVFSVTMRTVLLAAVLAAGAVEAALAVLAAGAVSRVAPLWLWALLPPARAGGLASSLARPKPGPVAVASLVAAVVALAAIPAAGADGVVIGLILAGIATAALGRLAIAKIGGQTGDVLGAAQQVAEIAFLAGLVL